jgi:hypothetical protein
MTLTRKSSEGHSGVVEDTNVGSRVGAFRGDGDHNGEARCVNSFITASEEILIETA